MKQTRIVLGVLDDEADEIARAWIKAVAKRSAPPGKYHKQIVGKVAVLRWDWMPINDHDINDLIGILEMPSTRTGYELIIIGSNNLGDVRYYKSTSLNALPVQLVPHITVDPIERRAEEPRGDIEQEEIWGKGEPV